MNIVDVRGLAKILGCSDRTLEKVWFEFPHFFIGRGRTLRGARFDLDDVIEHLKSRDYAIPRQNQKRVGRSGQGAWRQKKKNGLPDKIGGHGVGVVGKKRDDDAAPDCIEQFKRRFGLS